ncbi:General odorant-binding protein 19d [Eumeta japonica]|uniref:General odorant-binding protein 19d n=1 Tax=Eumeta variegata TaxID=151549 RepID=A0A4C1UZB7_EUMVA|nr:General odorant-binding protein 19d [Eumeta japonica]
MSRFVTFWAACLMCALPASVLSLTDEQKAAIHEHFEVIGMKCIKDNTISEEDINNLRARKMPSGENAPCFMACVLREAGVMDDKGKLQKESAMEAAKKVFKEEEELKNIEDYLHSCSHVNDAAVSDGEKGCERAMLALTCMIENSSKITITNEMEELGSKWSWVQNWDEDQHWYRGKD